MIIANKLGKYWFLIILLMIVSVGGFLRLYALGERPFKADEFLDINAIYGYNQTGQWQAWDFNTDAPSVRINPESDKRAWLYRVQVAKLFDLSFFPPEEWAARLVSVLWSIATIAIIYGVAYSWTRRHLVALVAAGLFAVSVPAIEMGRTLRMYAMFVPTFLLLVWSVSQFFGRRFTGYKEVSRTHITRFFNCDYRYLLLIVPLFALAIHLHPLTLNIVFAVLAVIIVATVIAYKRGVVQALSRYGSYTACALSILVMSLIFIQYADITLPPFLKLNDNFDYIHHILQTFWHPLIGLTLIGYGVWHSLTKNDEHTLGRLWVSVTFVTIFLLAATLWNRNIGGQYIAFMQPFALITAAIGAVALFDRMRAKHFSTGAFVLLLVVFLPQYSYFFQDNNTYSITAAGETPDYRKVFDYVKQNSSADEALITRNFRNYYYGGANLQVVDFGSERTEDVLAAEGKFSKITAEILAGVQGDNASGWFVYTDNDEQFISRDAEQYARDHFERVTDSSLVRGKVFVYRWR